MDFNLFDGLVILCGLYMAYSAIMMKAKGRINSGVVMSRNLDESRLKDKEGFIKYIWPRLFAIGLLCATSGLFNLSFSRIETEPETYVLVEVVVNTIFFVLLIIYGVMVSKAQKKYMK